MKKNILTTIVIAFLCFVCAAQTENSEILKLKSQFDKLDANSKVLADQLNATKKKLYNVEKKLSATNDSVRNLKNQILQTNGNVKIISDTLGLKIQNTNNRTTADISSLQSTLSKNTLYWIIIVLVITLLLIFSFGWLRKRLSKDKSDLTKHIKKASDTLRDEQMNLDQQLVNLLDNQMRLMKEQVQYDPNKLESVDHSLALKVADEIVRIQKNLSNMDVETKGLKQLAASVKRIQDTFDAIGYDLIEMLNQPYDQGMKVTANFRPDETLRPGEQIITRIIKPQVNFKGVMIQAAQVEVSVGE